MISCIVAVSENYVIGNHGIIPWRIKGEQKRFKDLTSGKTIIMGRKSFDEIGKPLPNRKTIIISNTLSMHENNCITVSSLTEALKITQNEEEVFIAGGGRVYAEAMPVVERIYLTIIHKEITGDTYFPRINRDIYELIYEEKIEGEISYTYYTYEKKV